MVIKYDAEGNTVWGVRISESYNEYIYAIAETSDGGIVVGGMFTLPIKLDNGQVLNKRFS